MTHVDWHPYPDEKPESYTKEYLLTVETHYGKHKVKKIGIDTWGDSIGGGEWEEFDNRSDSVVIAWAEKPEPYRQEAKNEIHE